MPTTSYPSDFNSAAVTEESTPPDMATTILVSCGRPSISRLLSMVPVTDAIAASLKMLRDREAILAISFVAFRKSGFRPIATAEKLFFNIGRIPARQSRWSGLPPADGKSCRRAEKGPAAGLRSLSDAPLRDWNI